MIKGVTLFIGVESQAWSLSQFQQAAKNAKALGVSSLLVKIADGANEWYSQLGGWQKVMETIRAEGINAIPYTYSYGDTFGGLQLEIAILKEAMSTVGIVVADMEAQWNGQVSWAQTLANALKDTPGIFGITTWADPQLQNWEGVIQALRPRVDVWLPQVYTDFLASVYKEQFVGLNVVPVLSLGEDFGPNDVVQHVREAQAPALALWEYQLATGGYEQVIKEIVAMSNIPAGWSDDGKTLRSPDGVPVMLGFRQFVLNNNWDPNDWPLRAEYGANPVEQSDAKSGGGTAQEFRFSRLCWTNAKGVYKSRVGQELLWYQNKK